MEILQKFSTDSLQVPIDILEEFPVKHVEEVSYTSRRISMGLLEESFKISAKTNDFRLKVGWIVNKNKVDGS